MLSYLLIIKRRNVSQNIPSSYFILCLSGPIDQNYLTKTIFPKYSISLEAI